MKVDLNHGGYWAQRYCPLTTEITGERSESALIDLLCGRLVAFRLRQKRGQRAGGKRKMKAQLCPKCNGQGIVSRPPWVPADVLTWSSSQTTFQCDVCNGAKILYVPDDAPNTDFNLTQPAASQVKS